MLEISTRIVFVGILILIPFSVMAQDYYVESDETVLKSSVRSREDSTGALTGVTTIRMTDRHDVLVCNRSHDETVSVAHIYVVNAEQRIKGWVSVRKGMCVTLVKRVSLVRFYAAGKKATWSGAYTGCVLPGWEFDVSASLERCPKGYEMVKFKLLVLDSESKRHAGIYRVHLTP